MSIIGIGFKLAILTLFYSILIGLFSDYSKLDFKINFMPDKFLIILGTILIIVGIPFLIISIITINKAYKAGSLRIDGVYSICRHPLYSSFFDNFYNLKFILY